MEEIAAQASASEADHQWVRDHLQELIDNYAGKYVGVLDGRILLVSEDPVEIDRLAAEKFPGRLPSVVPVPFEEDFDCLL
jgi:hypothetical protein